MYCLIVNKRSGNGRGFKTWLQVKKTLDEQNIPYCVHFTEPEQDALFIQNLMCQRRFTAIIVIGGDGTIHEVAAGLIGTKTPLGIIPAGSGNDFSRGLGIPLNHEKALRRILTGKPKIIDIGYVNATPFCSVAAIGFGEVAEAANTSKRKKWLNVLHLGKVSYMIHALNILARYKPMDMTLTIDRKPYHFKKVWFVAIANLPYYAGGLRICPHASSNDGLFDICIVRGISKWALLRLFPLVFNGAHVSSSAIEIIRGRELNISSPAPLLIHGDGEIIDQNPAQLRIKPHTLYVI
ncbi:diacylglycerol kinase family lipid kinase [Sporolactobacillus sp. THM7-7]|nr:diacylglycerol kinase family lipid kinase [Sporolactobacillus sp. THM7-7]